MNKPELIQKIGYCIERGKINSASPFPKDMAGEEGSDELTRQALTEACRPELILQACTEGMQKIGLKFEKGEAYIPELLMSAKAMNAVMAHLGPYFKSGSVKRKGKFILCTVKGDLHDIGKNLVSMVAEGNGWEVIDLGVDVNTEVIIKKIEETPGCVVGLSALLTTTMNNMKITVQEIKSAYPATKVIVGGAPLSQEAADHMGADAYAPNPQHAMNYLNRWVSAD